jgi:hypothetical protein
MRLKKVFCITKLANYALRVRIRYFAYYKYFLQDPKWLLMFVFSRFIFIRTIVSFFSKQPIALKYTVNSLFFRDINVDNIVRSLKNEGLYLGIQLPVETIEAILNYTNCELCYGNGSFENKFYLREKEDWEINYGKKLTIGEYFNASAQCSSIKALECDPFLLSIANKYFNKKPICLGTRLWWSFTNAQDYHKRLKFGQELFHYDLTGYQSLRFFFYITDVSLLDGPHVCICGSHKKKKFWHQLTLFVGRSDRAMIDYYGKEKIVSISGTSGFGFAEDPFCFHKGIPPTDKNRLALYIDFTC